MFAPLLILLLFCAVSAQGFTVTINGAPFQGAVDGESDAAFLEAAALTDTPGLDLHVEGTQVKLGGKDIPSIYRQGRVLRNSSSSGTAGRPSPSRSLQLDLSPAFEG